MLGPVAPGKRVFIGRAGPDPVCDREAEQVYEGFSDRNVILAAALGFLWQLHSTRARAARSGRNRHGNRSRPPDPPTLASWRPPCTRTAASSRPTLTDLRLPGRGIALVLDRSYRSSLAEAVGLLGRGWTSCLDRRIETVGDDLVHHDPTGRTQVFTRGLGGGRTSPPGCYALVREGRAGVELRERFGRSVRFDPPVGGGWLRALADANGNEITFEHTPDGITVTDTLGRQVRMTLTGGLITEVADHAGRRWTYAYDGDALLVEMVQATRDVPGGSAVRYGYDAGRRLVSVTDARGRTYLENRYDGDGRVVEQRYGDGTAVLTYADTGSGVRTTCRSATGAVVVLLHDPLGHLVSRTVEVRRDAFSAEDLPPGAGPTVPLVTTFELNWHSEVVARTDSAGGSTAWTFTEDDPDPRNRGNLVRVVRTPRPGVPADQDSLVTSVVVEGRFQRTVAVTDPRGQTTRHTYDRRGNRTATRYPPVTLQPVGDGGAVRPTPAPTELAESLAVNAAGQPLHTRHADGTVTAYAYHPEDDPGGAARGAPVDDPVGRGGYLARITRDAAGAAITTAYFYDAAARQARVVDGAGNATRLAWSPSGQVEEVGGRLPGHTLRQHYDEVGNLVASCPAAHRPGARRGHGCHYAGVRDGHRAGGVRHARPARHPHARG